MLLLVLIRGRSDEVEALDILEAKHSTVPCRKVINHQPYDQKADVFSFSIILWELVTAKVPYDTMTPLQAAFGVRQGLCPELPKHGHPKLLYLRQRCWEADPSNRPSFQEITIELENLLQQVDCFSNLGEEQSCACCGLYWLQLQE
ncbi:hypothetical protein AAHE18_14G167600 [Arachis hypogaea]